MHGCSAAAASGGGGSGSGSSGFSTSSFSSSASLLSDLLGTWQTDYGLMRCQECKRKNRAKGSEKLAFVTFRCTHFQHVCVNCAKSTACKYTVGNLVCNAPQMPVKQTASLERFPQRPWLGDEACMLNGHRKEVLDFRNVPPEEFAAPAEYETYAAERAEIAHDLHDEDDKVVTRRVDQYRSTTMTTQRRKALSKNIEEQLKKREARCARERAAVERAAREEAERQLQWLKRQRSKAGGERLHRAGTNPLDYNVFSGAERHTRKPAAGRGAGGGGGGAARARENGADGDESRSRGGGRGGDRKRRTNVAKLLLPEKPKRKYKFAGAGAAGAAAAAARDVRPADDFRAAGFQRKWEHDRFMADIEGAWGY